MSDKLLAVLDDDQVFADTLVRRLNKKGFSGCAFYQLQALLECNLTFDCIILDLNLGDHSVLAGLEQIRQQWPHARIVMLTGYASIATTVSAVKKGADDYLTKPVNMDQLLTALGGETLPEPEHKVISSSQLEWEHIQRVLQDNDGNISATARVLNMHRRTLQRKLQKKPMW